GRALEVGDPVDLVTGVTYLEGALGPKAVGRVAHADSSPTYLDVKITLSQTRLLPPSLPHLGGLVHGTSPDSPPTAPTERSVLAVLVALGPDPALGVEGQRQGLLSRRWADKQDLVAGLDRLVRAGRDRLPVAQDGDE